MERYINAKTRDGKDVRVFQIAAGMNEFIDDEHNVYSVEQLDFTHADFDLDGFLKSVERDNAESRERFEMLQKLYMSLDANAVADHKAMIDEREYWRKLRGDIAIEIIRQRGYGTHYGSSSNYEWIHNAADTLVQNLYEDDRKLFE